MDRRGRRPDRLHRARFAHLAAWIPAAGSRDDRCAKLAVRLRYAPPVTQLGQEAVYALTFKPDQPVGAGQRRRVCLLKIICKLPYFRLETISGNVSRKDENAYLYAVDRKIDMIFSGGSNGFEREVEEALLGLDGIAEAAATGVPHPKWGERVAAGLVSSSGEPLSPVILDDCCCAELADFRKPIRLFWCEALPPNRYGKVFKRDLCARHAQVQ